MFVKAMTLYAGIGRSNRLTRKTIHYYEWPKFKEYMVGRGPMYWLILQNLCWITTTTLGKTNLAPLPPLVYLNIIHDKSQAPWTS